MSDWISVKDRLPKDRIYVFAIHNRRNQFDSDDQRGVSAVVVKFIRGISEEERERMPDCTRKQRYTRADQYGNNLKPYCWDQFGPDFFFGQSITHWKLIEFPNERE